MQIAKIGKPLKDLDPKNYREQFGANLRRLRCKKFSTLPEFHSSLLENGLDVTSSLPSLWERGVREPQIEWLPYIAATLGCPVKALFPEESR